MLRVLSAALCGAPALTALNLSDNALGEKGVRACEAVLTGKVGRVRGACLHGMCVGVVHILVLWGTRACTLSWQCGRARCGMLGV